MYLHQMTTLIDEGDEGDHGDESDFNGEAYHSNYIRSNEEVAVVKELFDIEDVVVSTISFRKTEWPRYIKKKGPLLTLLKG